MRRAGVQFFCFEAVTRALVAACFPSLVKRAVIQVDEVFCQDRHGRSAGMIEEECTHFQIYEVGLVADNFQVRIP